MNKDKLVSIVIPAYNGERFIGEAVTSAVEQTHKNLEIIIYDDGSEDKTADMVRYIKDERIQYFHSENEGLVRTLNKAINLSHGEYICWLNQDDIFLPEKVETQLKSFDDNDSLGAVFCIKNDINENGKLINLLNPLDPLSILNPSVFCPNGRENILLMLFQGCFLSASTVMIKRDVLSTVGQFDEGIKIAFDFDMWFRIIKKYNIKIIDRPLSNFRHHEHNLSGKKGGQPLAILESCVIIMNALEMFSIEDIFPELKKNFFRDSEKRTAYSNAYLKWADFIFRNKWWSPYLLMPIYRLVHKALSINPLLAEAYRLAADICNDAGLTAQREFYHKKYHEQAALFHYFLDGLEDSLKNREQEESLQLSDKVFSIFPEHPDIYSRLRMVFKNMGRPEEAEYYNSFF